jgi:uncharacterized membrane protein YedE/YeeE
MAGFIIVLGWCCYVAWLVRASESDRQVHLVVAWAALALGAVTGLVLLLL